MFYIVMLVDFEVWVLELEDADYRETSPPPSPSPEKVLDFNYQRIGAPQP